MKKKKTLGKLIQDAQKVFNKWIRERDKGKPCISCGAFNTLQAGHYFAVGGYAGLRFDEDNVHGECARCNCWDESHLIGYGVNLEKRIGQENVLKLHHRAAEYKRNGYRFSRSEVLDIIEKYKL